MERYIKDDDWTQGFFEFLLSRAMEPIFVPKKRKIIFFTKDGEKPVGLRLSLSLSYNKDLNILQSEDFINYILLFVRSGLASIAFFENFELQDHRVFRAYMVRKKQGKSQVKYLKTKGKSRAGSRVRLAETEIFFREITERLQSYENTHRVDLLGISCSETLLPFLFGEKTFNPFGKKDQRIFRIPIHVANPTFENLKKAEKILLKNTWQFRDEAIPLIDAFEKERGTLQQKEDEEDW